METPFMQSPRPVAADTHALTAYIPIPGFGILPASAFLIRAPEPVLVDAGVVAMRDDFLGALESLIDLEDLRWIFLTHTDPDHVGCLEEVLAAAPRARLVTTYLGMGKLGLRAPVDPSRVHLLNPGQSLDVGDRHLVALRPPSFDAPETTGLFDARTRALFSADCFGALMQAPAESAREIEPSELGEGLVSWAMVDAPWLPWISEAAFAQAAGAVRELDPSIVLSSHLPPAPGMAGALLEHLARARSAPAFVGPDQAALEAMFSAA